MAIPWIQVYSNIVTHPKTSNLVDELGITSSATEPEAVAVGMLIGLWTWAAVNAYDGNLNGVAPRTIARACNWKKNPDKLIAALVKCGWIDEDMKIHDWAEYAELYINRLDYQREQAKERMRRFRERKRNEAGIKTCAYCGKTATGFDHIVPRSKGGTDDPDNLIPCCKRCNSSKGAKSLADFLNTTTVKLDIDSILQNDQLMERLSVDEFGRFFDLL